MGRQPLQSGYDSQALRVRLSKDQMALLDKRRGTMTRSQFIRHLITVTPETPPKIEVRQMPVAEKRHLHRFQRGGEPVRFEKGQPLFHYFCECGVTKVDR